MPLTAHAKCVIRPGQELFVFHSHPSGRTALGLTVRQAAELAGCSHETVVAIESGRSSVKQVRSKGCLSNKTALAMIFSWPSVEKHLLEIEKRDPAPIDST